MDFSEKTYLTSWKVNNSFRSVNNYDIIGWVETHSGPDDNICMDDYHLGE